MLQFITHTHPTLSIDRCVEQVLKGGCRWIQLRMKEASLPDVRETALRLVPLCHAYGATFLLDDHVLLAAEVGADGVHLGKMDMPPRQARELVGNKLLIGGTANTLRDVEELAAAGVDYIGLGPYRFTETKKNLSPVLGVEGYRSILTAARAQGIDLPIVAIGGIEKADIPQLMETGVTGIALSGTLLRADDLILATKQIVQIIQ